MNADDVHRYTYGHTHEHTCAHTRCICSEVYLLEMAHWCVCGRVSAGDPHACLRTELISVLWAHTGTCSCSGSHCSHTGLSVCMWALRAGLSSLGAGRTEEAGYRCFCRFPSSGWGRPCGHRTALPGAVGLGRPQSRPPVSHPGHGPSPPGTPASCPYLGINHGREEGPKILCGLEARETPGELESPRAADKGAPSPHTPAPLPLPLLPPPPRSLQSHQPPAGPRRGGHATHVAHFDPAMLLQQPPFDLRPQRLRHVEAGAG